MIHNAPPLIDIYGTRKLIIKKINGKTSLNGSKTFIESFMFFILSNDTQEF